MSLFGSLFAAAAIKSRRVTKVPDFSTPAFYYVKSGYLYANRKRVMRVPNFSPSAFYYVKGGYLYVRPR